MRLSLEQRSLPAVVRLRAEASFARPWCRCVQLLAALPLVSQHASAVALGRQSGHLRSAEAGRESDEPVTYEGIYRIRMQSIGRYLDAYEGNYDHGDGRPGYEVITRPEQNATVRDGLDHTQFWTISKDKGDSYSLMHYTTGRFLDAMDNSSGSSWQTYFVCMTDVPTDLDLPGGLTQSWYITPMANGTDMNVVTLTQASSMQLLGGYTSATYDYQVGVSNELDRETTVWVLEKIASRPLPLYDGMYAITQKSTGRRLDVHEAGGNSTDTAVITREVEFSSSQRFLIRRIRGEVYYITQQSTGYALGAHPAPPSELTNYTVVTRRLQKDRSQQWRLDRIRYDLFVVVHLPTGRVLEAYPDSSAGHDYRVYTAAASLAGLDGNISEALWSFQKIMGLPALNGFYTIQQKSTKRYLTGSTSGTLSLSDRVRSQVGQIWEIDKVPGDFYNIKLNGTDFGLDALPLTLTPTMPPAVYLHQLIGRSTQAWYLIWINDDTYQFRQHLTDRYLEATLGNSDLITDDVSSTEQEFEVVKVGQRCPVRLVCPATRACGFVDDGCGGQSPCGMSDGTCTQRNNITGVQHKCGLDFECECVPKLVCDAETCGTNQSDGCGGFVQCAACNASDSSEDIGENVTQESTNNNDTSKSTDYDRDPVSIEVVVGNVSEGNTSQCVPGAHCTANMSCGFVDNCSGIEFCGPYSGLCPKSAEGHQLQCTSQHTCECVPKVCGTRCGAFSDGCGGNMTCSCADGIPSTTTGVPAAEPNLFQTYSYYYYLFYYYYWFLYKDAGVDSATAGREAQLLAKYAAQEQIRRTWASRADPNHLPDPSSPSSVLPPAGAGSVDVATAAEDSGFEAGKLPKTSAEVHPASDERAADSIVVTTSVEPPESIAFATTSLEPTVTSTSETLVADKDLEESTSKGEPAKASRTLGKMMWDRLFGISELQFLASLRGASRPVAA